MFMIVINIIKRGEAWKQGCVQGRCLINGMKLDCETPSPTAARNLSKYSPSILQSLSDEYYECFTAAISVLN
jgi:hypothetical protein